MLSSEGVRLRTEVGECFRSVSSRGGVSGLSGSEDSASGLARARFVRQVATPLLCSRRKTVLNQTLDSV